MGDFKFPKNFLWGAATSAYQIEGGSFNTDWYEWEQKGKTKDECGKACDYWNRYKGDHNLLDELGANAFRLSIEWARIEPEEGRFSEEAIQHYREILKDLKRRNVKTAVTLWHWVSPLWFQKRYGFNKKESVEIFVRYGSKIVDELGDLIDLAVTINEPMMPLAFGFILGKFPPGKMCPFSYVRSFKNLSKAHKKIYNHIKNKFDIPVGITTLYNYFEPFNKYNPLDIAVAYCMKKIWNWSFADSIKNHVDYFGVDYYFHYRMTIAGKRNEDKEVSDMGWEVYPEGIYRILREINRRYGKPIYIFENGIADKGDIHRAEFIQRHIEYISKAIQEGVDVRGYFYWSLLDNYEWLHGYAPCFGLVEVDYQTLERKPRKSFYAYKKIIEKNKQQ